MHLSREGRCRLIWQTDALTMYNVFYLRLAHGALPATWSGGNVQGSAGPCVSLPRSLWVFGTSLPAMIVSLLWKITPPHPHQIPLKKGTLVERPFQLTFRRPALCKEKVELLLTYSNPSETTKHGICEYIGSYSRNNF